MTDKEFRYLTYTTLLCSIFLSIVIAICLLFTMKQKIVKQEQLIAQQQEQLDRLQEKVDEHEEVMVTYKFFNWSWEAIMKKEEK